MKNNMESNNIDEIFKNSLETKEGKVSDGAWNRLEFMLDDFEIKKKKRRNRLLFFAASIAILLFVGVFHFSSSPTKKQLKIVEKKETLIDSNSIQISSNKEIQKIDPIKNEISKIEIHKNQKIVEIPIENPELMEVQISIKDTNIVANKKTINIEAEKLLALVEDEISEEEKNYTIKNPLTENRVLTRKMLDSILVAELDFNFKSTGIQIDAETLLAEIETEIDFDNSILDKSVLGIIKEKIKKLTTAVASND
ncbi:hypothetical protein [Aureivirga marina]|uniref:hypothetical protein n=1 Tax=Aureivirga marina TaxID=1182451 RepID=UPI0018CABBFC|nr:hypothetical protein [Aureivirga marina]